MCQVNTSEVEVATENIPVYKVFDKKGYEDQVVTPFMLTSIHNVTMEEARMDCDMGYHSFKSRKTAIRYKNLVTKEDLLHKGSPEKLFIKKLYIPKGALYAEGYTTYSDINFKSIKSNFLRDRKDDIAAKNKKQENAKEGIGYVDPRTTLLIQAYHRWPKKLKEEYSILQIVEV